MNITHTHIFILICILQVLDVVTTLYCLRKGIGKEANPVMRKLMDAGWWARAARAGQAQGSGARTV